MAIITMTIMSMIAYYVSKKSLQEQSFEKLTAIRNGKAQEIERYFNNLNNLAKLITEHKSTVTAFEKFSEGFEELKKVELTKEELVQLRTLRDDFYYKDYLAKSGSHAMDRNTFVKYLPTDQTSVLFQCIVNNLTDKHKEAFDNYKKAFIDHDTTYQNFQKYTDFGGLLFIDSKNGDVVYTVNRLSDIGANVHRDSLSQTNLAAIFKKTCTSKKPIIETIDYQIYYPAQHLSKAFMAAPIIQNGKNIGVVAFRIPDDSINEIMTFNKKWAENGLGTTGETYLVDDSYTLRSSTRFTSDGKEKFQLNYPNNESNNLTKEPQKETSINTIIKTDATINAIDGSTDTKILKDYRGNEVLSAYMPLNVVGLNWALIAKIDTEEAFQNIQLLKKFVFICFFVLLITVLIVGSLIAYKISKPINELTLGAVEISKGNYNTDILIKRKDEIGILANSFIEMRKKIIELINNLQMSNSTLEEKQREIFESIRYAKKIQDNILAEETVLDQNLNDYFVYFNPKDIVSGDFYWATTSQNSFYLAVCDSTGHGIPGAFMSLINVSFLSEAISMKRISDPASILNEVRDSLVNAMVNEENKDGMDGVLLRIDRETNALSYAGAYNKPILIRDNNIIECEIDRMSIGKSIKEDKFNLFQLNTQPGDMLYLFSDGFADQFGGMMNKKYKLKRLGEFMSKISQESSSKQKQLLQKEFEDWKGNNEQTDDVIVFGIKF